MGISTTFPAASLGIYTGHVNAEVLRMDSSAGDWATLRAAAKTVARKRCAGRVDPDKVTNEDVLEEWYDTWCMARILDQASRDENDRHAQQAARLHDREPEIWRQSFEALLTDEDGNGTADRRQGRGLPRTFNVIRQADTMLGLQLPGSSSGGAVFWPT